MMLMPDVCSVLHCRPTLRSCPTLYCLFVGWLVLEQSHGKIGRRSGSLA